MYIIHYTSNMYFLCALNCSVQTRRAGTAPCDSVLLQVHHSALGMRISSVRCIGAFHIIILLRNERLLIVFVLSYRLYVAAASLNSCAIHFKHASIL